MKLFFLDIDGTISLYGRPPSERLKVVLHELHLQGDKIFLCTGRTEEYTPEVMKALEIDGAVYCAGGQIKVGGEEIHRAFMSSELQARLIELMASLRARYVLECEKGSFCAGIPVEELAENITPGSMLHHAITKLSEMTDERKPIEEYSDEPVFKIVFIFGSIAQGERLKAAVPSNTCLVFFNELFPGCPLSLGEVSDANNDKAAAMRRLADYYNVPIEDCVAFGDSMNDASILQAAGEGIAMGNASDEVKALADRVCGQCTEDGLAIELEKYIWNKRLR